MRRVLALGLVALALPAVAWSHAQLTGTSPGFQQELRRAPKTITLRFDQLVQLPSVAVLDEKGRNWALGAASHGLSVVARLRTLPTGAYNSPLRTA